MERENAGVGVVYINLRALPSPAALGAAAVGNQHLNGGCMQRRVSTRRQRESRLSHGGHHDSLEQPQGRRYPWDHCPNIRSAFIAVGKAGFAWMRVLQLPHNFKQDWIDKDLPVQTGE